MKEICKYITHQETGYPLRVAPSVRNMLRNGEGDADVLLDLAQTFPHIGERRREDFAVHNIEENIRLRRIARELVSPILIDTAKKWGVESYCTLVHGSLARGLVRNPRHGGKSDIDIAFIVGDDVVPDEERQSIRPLLYDVAVDIGVPIDCSVKQIKEVKRNNGQLARIFAAASAYPLVNVGKTWEEVIQIATNTHEFLLFDKAERRSVRAFLQAVVESNFEKAQTLHRIDITPKAHLLQYLEKHGLYQKDAQTYAEKLYELVR